MNFASRRTALLGCTLLLAPAHGCRKPVYFPAVAHSTSPAAQGQTIAFDADLDGKADWFLFANAHGRADTIGYDLTGDETPDERIPLDSIPFSRCRHLVILLDGVSFELVREYYDSGHLRLFHPPSRVISPYPSMTDVAVQDLLDGMPVRGFEAKCYDRGQNRLIGGSGDYLSGGNEPYDRLIQYRAAKLWDAIGYVLPWAVFGKEVNDAMRLFRKAETTEMIGYFVSAAGMATSKGAEGHRMCLERIEQFINQVVWETRGLTKVTLMSDHGHTYTPGTRVDFEAYLKQRGWRPAKRLAGERDVVQVKFGLVTYASFAALRPRQLAEDLAGHEAVDVVSFADGDAVVVLRSGGEQAVVRQKAGRYKYETVVGDPLKLSKVLAGLEPDEEGYFDADAMLAATVEHEYPAPLERLWRAHFGLVYDPPDVIASLHNEFFAGLASFAGRVTVASTHGGLNRDNSSAFIMSTIGPLPAVMRSRDVPADMKKLTGKDWPLGR